MQTTSFQTRTSILHALYATNPLVTNIPADSWLEGENNNIANLHSETSGLSERIYSGRESPHKTIHVRSSAENRARMSAFSTSTADSFDYAFQRKPPIAPVDTTKDDFFDS